MDTRRRFEEDVFLVMNSWHLDPYKKETLYEQFKKAGFFLTFNTYYKNKDKVCNYTVNVPSRPKFRIEPCDINIKRTISYGENLDRIFNSNKKINPIYEMSLQQAWLLFNKNNV